MSFDDIVSGGPPEPTPLGAIPDDDPVAMALRRALAREAEGVHPSADGLARIREVIEDGRPSRHELTSRRATRPVWLILAAAAAAAVVAGTATVLGGTGGHGGNVAHPGPSTTASSPVSPSPSPSGSTGAAAGGLPVYYPGDQGSRVALFREFHPTASTDPATRVQEAVSEALSQRPLDPDYRLVWAPGSAATTSLRPDLITIDLNAAAASTGLGSEAATVAVQQLVWTATAAAGTTVPVQLSVQGASTELFGSVPIDRPIARAVGDADPRGLVWIDSLAEGARVPAGRLHITGQGVNAFENTLVWTLTRADTQVDHGTFGVTSESGQPVDTGQRGLWSLDVDVNTPGTYTLRVEVSAAVEGQVTPFDSKTFTVGG